MDADARAIQVETASGPAGGPAGGQTPGPAQSGPDGGGARREALRAVVALDEAACPHCGYSLRGLGAGGVPPDRCPECGGGLSAGLVGTVGPRALRRLMVLMFAWVSFAGVMNATRQWLFIQDYYLAVQSRGPIVSTFVGGAPIPRGGWASVRLADWISLGGWSALGIAGIIGIIATARRRAGALRTERRLIGVLVACFLLYWGYHGVMFGFEMMQRF